MSANWLLVVARLTPDTEEKWTCIVPAWKLHGVGQGNPERPTKVPGHALHREVCQAFYKHAHLIFATSKRGWFYLSCFPVKETEAQKVQRTLYKVTELVSGRGRSWISSLSHGLLAVINVISQQYHIVRKTSFKYQRFQTSLGWVQMTSKFVTLILKTQSSSPPASWTFPLGHPSQNYSSTCELKELPSLQNRGPRPCLLLLPCVFSGTSSNLLVWVHLNPSLGILSLNYFLLPSLIFYFHHA